MTCMYGKMKTNYTWETVNKMMPIILQGASSVILVEVANQDKIGSNSHLAGFLHASGILQESDGTQVGQVEDSPELKDGKAEQTMKPESQTVASLSLGLLNIVFYVSEYCEIRYKE